MTPEQYSRYPLVDSAVGSRILLALRVEQRALEQRVRPPWQLAPLPAFAALGLEGPHQPNLVLVFHDLLLDQDTQGQVLTDSGGRFVVFNIPAAKPESHAVRSIGPGRVSGPGELWILTSRNDQMHVRRQVLDQKGEGIVNRLGLNHVVVVQDEDEIVRDGGDFIEQSNQN